MKVLEVFDSDFSLEKDSEGSTTSPSAEDSTSPPLRSKSFTIESILSRKDPSQTEKKRQVSDTVGTSFSVDQLMNSNKENHDEEFEKLNRAFSAESENVAGTETSQPLSSNITPSENGGIQMEKTTDGTACTENSRALAPIYIPTVKYYDFDSCVAPEAIDSASSHRSSVTVEMFENFRSSSILTLRTRAEEHYRQLRTSLVS